MFAAWQVFVTLDSYGNLCTFADADAPQPAVLCRPSECDPDAPLGCAEAGHDFAFVVRWDFYWFSLFFHCFSTVLRLFCD